jgi:hypothetical protein
MKDARVQDLRDAIGNEFGLFMEYEIAQRVMQHIDAQAARRTVSGQEARSIPSVRLHGETEALINRVWFDTEGVLNIHLVAAPIPATEQK